MTYLDAVSEHLDDGLHCERHGEEDVGVTEQTVVPLGLVVKLRWMCPGCDDDDDDD